MPLQKYQRLLDEPALAPDTGIGKQARRVERSQTSECRSTAARGFHRDAIDRRSLAWYKWVFLEIASDGDRLERPRYVGELAPWRSWRAPCRGPGVWLDDRLPAS